MKDFSTIPHCFSGDCLTRPLRENSRLICLSGCTMWMSIGLCVVLRRYSRLSPVNLVTREKHPSHPQNKETRTRLETAAFHRCPRRVTDVQASRREMDFDVRLLRWQRNVDKAACFQTSCLVLSSDPSDVARSKPLRVHFSLTCWPFQSFCGSSPSSTCSLRTA